MTDLLVQMLGFAELDPRLRDDEVATVIGQRIASEGRACCLVFDALDEAVRAEEMWRLLLRPLTKVNGIR